MTVYTDEQRISFFAGFRRNYKQVLRYSDLPNISCMQMLDYPGKTKILGQFYAAAGLPGIDVVPLQFTIGIVDRYLENGILIQKEMDGISRQLEQQIGPLTEIFEEYKSQKIARDDGIGAPQILFVPFYAHCLLSTCDMIEQKYEGSRKNEVLKCLAAKRYYKGHGKAPMLV